MPNNELIFYNCDIILCFQEPNGLGSFIDKVAWLNYWKVVAFA